MSEKIECAKCKRMIAASFAKCPLCNHPVSLGVSGSPPPSNPARADGLPPAGGVQQPVPEALVQARMLQALHGMQAQRAARQPAPTGSSWIAGALIKIGGALVLFSALPIGCTYMFTRPTLQVSVDDLGGMTQRTQVLVSDGIADWREKLDIDLATPVTVDTAELLAQRKELRGRAVHVTGVPESVAIRKQYQYQNGERIELERDTRVYAPLLGSNRAIWVLSPAMDLKALADPRVEEFAKQGSYDGIVEWLGDIVPLEELRNASHESGDGGTHVLEMPTSSAVPDDAVAVIAITSTLEGRKHVMTKLTGTKGRIWAVADTTPAASDDPLFGDYQPCPAEACKDLVSFTQPAAEGLLFLRPLSEQNSRVSKIGVLTLIAGIALIVSGIVVMRRS